MHKDETSGRDTGIHRITTVRYDINSLRYQRSKIRNELTNNKCHRSQPFHK